jgi:pimeloyl-ACP methyl ester carboxylesterase
VAVRHAVTDRITPKLSTVRLPALLVRGSRDRIAPRPWLDHLATLISDATTLVLRGAAHNASPGASGG